MPNRILREGILTSPRMARLGGWADEVFYRRLMSVVDDFGRYYADPGLLRAACYPRQLNKVSDSDIGKWLTACVTAALVRVYPASDGESYLQLLDFKQQVRTKTSRFPDPPSTCAADATHASSDGEADEHLDVFVDVDVKEANASSSTAGPPTCPHLRILELFGQHCPTLPQSRPELWDGTKADNLRARWKWLFTAKRRDGTRYATTTEEALDWLGRFFAHVEASDFLSGRTGAWTKCSLDWLVKPDNFAKVVQGNYSNDGDTEP